MCFETVPLTIVEKRKAGAWAQKPLQVRGDGDVTKVVLMEMEESEWLVTVMSTRKGAAMQSFPARQPD